jgi:hypothetical protein
MMEAQVRASNRHLYADVGPKLGLNKEAATKLTDLLTEQQLANMNAMRGADSPEEAARRSEKLTQENEQAISDLIGPDKAQSLKEYQQTIPARMEVESLARQLEGNETALTAEQHQKLVDIYVAERARVPQPEYTDGMDNEEYAKAMTAWRDDYEKRTSAEASQVLNTEQFTAFNEIQQWQQEMRAQMPAGMQAGPMFRGGRADVAPNLMFNTVVAAGPASVSAGGTSATAQPQKKP